MSGFLRWLNPSAALVAVTTAICGLTILCLIAISPAPWFDFVFNHSVEFVVGVFTIGAVWSVWSLIRSTFEGLVSDATRIGTTRIDEDDIEEITLPKPPARERAGNGMRINNEFTLSVPVEQAWATMLDLERITPCLPGAAIQEEKGDGEYDGTMKVKIGPITTNYKGTVKFEEVDEDNHRAVLRATGRDVRGQGTALVTIVSTLQEKEGDDTRVNVETAMHLTGRAAQFGRGIAQDVASKILDQFAECLKREISGGSGAGS